MVTGTGRASLHWGSSFRPWRGGVYRWTETGTCHQGPLSRRQAGRTQSRPPPPPHETDSVHPASSWGTLWGPVGSCGQCGVLCSDVGSYQVLWYAVEILEQCGVLWAVALFLYGTHTEQKFWVGRRRERRGAEHKCTTAMVRPGWRQPPAWSRGCQVRIPKVLGARW